MPSSNGKKKNLDILLTTYPEQGSRNVGDNLISASALKLIRYRVPSYDPVVIFREESLERFEKSTVRTILAPGFSVKDGTYPELFRLYADIGSLPKLFYPVGCSFQHFAPLKETYENYEYSEETLGFLRSIVQRSGPLPCRDQLIVEMLNRHKVPALYCGDLALYDDNIIGRKFVPPAIVRSVVFTVQHKPKFMQQSFAMLDLIKAEFPSAELYVVHHSRINKDSQQVSGYAKSIGFFERDLSGDVGNLDFYEGIDLHIGYRLHGHISFLRRRKPSCLLIEDARSFGIANTGNLRIGAFDAMQLDGTTVDRDAPQKVIRYVREQVRVGFVDYNNIFLFIDQSYKRYVRPHFDMISAKLGWQNKRLMVFKKFNVGGVALLKSKIKKGLVEQIRQSNILFRLAVRVVGKQKAVFEPNQASGVATALGVSIQSRDDVAVLAYSIANATDPLAALNYYSDYFNFSNKTLWQALCNLQEKRIPAFDRIIHDAMRVSSPELRLQLLIKQALLQQAPVSDDTLGCFVDTYNCIWSQLESRKGVMSALASVLIDKAPVKNIEQWLKKVGLDVFSLTELQQLKFLLRIVRAQDKVYFANWESRLLPMLTQSAKLKVMLMRFSVSGERNAFSKLEEIFCDMDFDISHRYSAQIKPTFDQIPECNNFLNARFNPRLIDALQSLVLQKITDRQSFAYMRLGDGESYGFTDSQYIDSVGFTRQELHWWGAELDETLRHELQDKFQAGLAHANLLGVPSVLRLIKDLKLSARGEYPRDSVISRLFCVMYGVRPFLVSKLVLEDQSNLFLFDPDFIRKICHLAKRVYVVSGLNSALVDGWAPDKNKVEHIEVPTHRLLRNGDVGNSMTGIFPHVYHEYLNKVSALAEPGVVFLFSAGFIGKILIAEAAKNGAVALDIGQFLIPAVTETEVV